MAITNATEVIAEVMAQYSGSDTTSVTDMLKITVDEICRDFALAVSRASLALTADTQEYAIGSGAPWYTQTNNTVTATTESVVRIKSALYIKDADSGEVPLIPTVPEELIEDYPRYRYDDSADPTHVYTTVGTTGGMMFGLYPKPDTTSVNDTTTTLSYPRVDFEFHSKITFTGTTTVPSAITNPLLLVYGTAAKIAQREGDLDRHGYFEQLYNMERASLQKELTSRHIKRKPNHGPMVNAPRVR